MPTWMASPSMAGNRPCLVEVTDAAGLFAGLRVSCKEAPVVMESFSQAENTLQMQHQAATAWTDPVIKILKARSNPTACLELTLDSLQEAVSAASYACSEATATPAEACLASREAVSALEQLLQHLMPLGYLLLTDSFTFHLLQSQQAYAAAVEPIKTTMSQSLKYLEHLADHLLAAAKTGTTEGLARMAMGHAQGEASDGAAADLRPLLPLLAAACSSMLDLAIASAHFVAAGSPITATASTTSGQTWALTDPLACTYTKFPAPEVTAAAGAALDPAVAAAAKAAAASPVPKEMASFFVLNLSWSWLNKLLRKVPLSLQPQVLPNSGISAGLAASLSHLSHSLQHLAVQPGKKTVTVVKFWLQCAKNMLAVAPGKVVGGPLWQQLLQLTLTAFQELEQSSDTPPTGSAEESYPFLLSNHVVPRMVPCLLAALTAHGLPSQDLAASLQLIAQLPQTAPASHASTSLHQSLTEVPTPGSAHAGCCMAHIQVASELLLGLATLADPAAGAGAGQHSQHSSTATRAGTDALVVAAAPVAAAAARQLLGWVLRASCEELYCHLLQGELGEGPGAQLLLPCTAFLLRCAAVPEWEEAWLEGDSQLLSAALSPHPNTSYLGTTLLADLLHCASQELQTGQLEDLWQLLLDVVVAEAAVAQTLGHCWRTQQLLAVLAELTQACSAAVIKSFTDSLHTAVDRGEVQPDAASCAEHAVRCNLLQLLLHVAPPAGAAADAAISSCLAHVQQTLDYLSSIQQRQQQPEQQLIVLAGQQLAWQLEALAGTLAYMLACNTTANQGTSAKFCSTAAVAAVAAAADSLKLASSTLSKTNPTAAAAAAHQAQHMPAATSSSSSPTGVAPMYAAAALHVLEVGGQLLPVEGLGQLAEVLLVLSSCRELLPGIAGVAVHLSLAKPEPPALSKLFHCLLSCPDWPVQHAATQALLQCMRHSGNLGFHHLIPQHLMQDPTTAHPRFTAAIKAHLQQQPQEQDVAAYQQQYPITQQLHANILLHWSHKETAAGLQGGSSPEHQTPAKALQDLEQLLASVQAAANHGGGSGKEQQGGQAQVAAAAAAAGPAQQFLQRVGSTRNGLTTLRQAIDSTQGEVSALLHMARGLTQPGGQVDGMVLYNSLTQLMGDVTSLSSRLRGVQETLAGALS